MVPFSSSSDHVLCLVICFTNSPVHKFFELFPDFDGKEEILDLHLWEELSCGVHSVSMDAPDMDGYLIGKVQKYE